MAEISKMSKDWHGELQLTLMGTPSGDTHGNLQIHPIGDQRLHLPSYHTTQF